MGGGIRAVVPPSSEVWGVVAVSSVVGVNGGVVSQLMLLFGSLGARGVVSAALLSSSAGLAGVMLRRVSRVRGELITSCEVVGNSVLKREYVLLSNVPLPEPAGSTVSMKAELGLLVVEREAVVVLGLVIRVELGIEVVDLRRKRDHLIAAPSAGDTCVCGINVRTCELLA